MAAVPDSYVVAGGSIAGLATSLGLARAGSAVTIIERDGITIASDPEEAFLAERPGVPQSNFLHAFLARMVMVLRERFPDVLDEMIAAGARIDRPPAAEGIDDDVCLLLARRSTVEWVLRRAVAAEPNVKVIPGRTVNGARFSGRTVDGAVLDDGIVVPGAMIACTGRRADIGSWLSPSGAQIEEHLVRSDLIYITRWYLAPDFDMGTSGLLRDLGYLSYLVVPADGGTLAVAVGLPPEDRQLREILLDDDGFDRVAQLLPGLGEALTSAGARPLRSSKPMAGLVNQLRRFVDRSGEPLVDGFFAVGDAHTCTNPAYGRGCSLALVQSALLVDAIAANAGDATSAAASYEAACAREVEPWFHSSVMMDQARASVRKGEKPAGSGQFDVLALLQSIATGTVKDPVIIRGFARLLHVLATPAQLFSDPEFMARVMELMSNPPPVPVGESVPTREDLLRSASAAA